MASQQANLDDLIKAVEHQHDQYIRRLRALQDDPASQARTRPRADSRISVLDPITPPLRAMTGPTFGAAAAPVSTAVSRPRPRRSTLEVESTDRPSFFPSPRPFFRPSPNPSDGESFAVQDDDLAFIPLLDLPRKPTDDAVPRVHRKLTPMSFSDDMLLRHLRGGAFSDDMAGVLQDVLHRRAEMDLAVSFRDFAAFEREQYISTTFEVYDIAEDATATKTSLDTDAQGVGCKYSGEGSPFESPDGIVDAPMVWEAIREVNPDGQSVGRITIVQEPTPLILASLHHTMSPHFDTTELLTHLISDVPNRGRTHAFMHRAFERSPDPSTTPHHLRQRSFFFVFKYYTVVGEGLEPAPWQRFDKRPLDKRLGDHIDIAECSSVLALSLGGEPTKPLRMRPRRERAREGSLFDTFAPWHLLSIQSFPDDLHTVRGEEFQQKSFCNGPCAFLELLIAEYRDAGKRNQVLHERITKLITPPTEFMFDRRLRDKLLFEDKHFTYIRRYFWAYNTLAVVNTGIKAMVAAYADTFTDDFWSGTHPLLWPHQPPSSPSSSPDAPSATAYLDKMAVLRKELEKVVAELGAVLKRNERTRKEIENLRDQLFSGSSIKESRRAIDQGDNIRILTMISMIFLPLTFVTSVFGITEFTIPATNWRFPVVMVLVCVPFMLVIFLLQTRSFTALVRKLYEVPASLLLRWDADLADGRSTAAPRKGRKRRRMVAAVGRTSASKWRLPWLRKRQGAEDVDLGRV